MGDFWGSESSDQYRAIPGAPQLRSMNNPHNFGAVGGRRQHCCHGLPLPRPVATIPGHLFLNSNLQSVLPVTVRNKGGDKGRTAQWVKGLLLKHGNSPAPM